VRVAFVTDTYFPRINGVSASTRTFAGELRRLGHHVAVYAPEYPGAEWEEDGVWRFPSHYLWFDPEDRLARPFGRAARHAVAERYDVIHTQTPFSLGIAALRWARRSGARVVHTYHTLFSAYVEHYLRFVPRRLSIPLVRAISRAYCDRCDRIVVPSSEMRRELRGYGLRSPVQVIPTGTDPGRLAGADRHRLRRELGVPDDAPLLLFMGRVAEEKNIDFLFDVVARLRPRLPSLRLWVAGEGPARPRLERLAAEPRLGGAVRFLGYLNREDWRDCYAAADAFVFASMTETQGLVVTEAMAAGTPVVAVGAMGILDVMASGRGGFVTRLDREEFSERVAQLVSSPELREQKSLEAVDEAARWSSAAMAERLVGAYEAVLAGGVTAAAP